MAATSSDAAAFPASVKSVLMGAVPDRGGRPQEDRAAAAAAAMPAWAPRRATGAHVRDRVLFWRLRLARRLTMPEAYC